MGIAGWGNIHPTRCASAARSSYKQAESALREGRPPYESAEGICACAVLPTSKTNA
jgi:hypothetical protein